MGALSAFMFKTLWFDIPEGQYSIKYNSTTGYWNRINLFRASRLRGILQTRVFKQRVIITSCFYFSSVVALVVILVEENLGDDRCTNVFGSRTRHTDQPTFMKLAILSILRTIMPTFTATSSLSFQFVFVCIPTGPAIGETGSASLAVQAAAVRDMSSSLSKSNESSLRSLLVDASCEVAAWTCALVNDAPISMRLFQSRIRFLMITRLFVNDHLIPHGCESTECNARVIVGYAWAVILVAMMVVAEES
jgi:hypothetical protein